MKKSRLKGSQLAKHLVALVCYFSFGILTAQDSNLPEESGKIHKGKIFIQLDNDRFYFTKTDRYYTSGIHLGYRQFIDDGTKLDRLTDRYFPKGKRLFYSIQVGQKIYTPQDIAEMDMGNFDRPYAGWLFIKGSLDLFYNKRALHAINIDAGLTGPGSGAGNFQNWYHSKTNITTPEGWEYQISSSPAVNFRYTFNRAWVESPFFELSSRSSYQMGTLFHNLGQGIGVRMGKLKPFDRSAFTNSDLMESGQVHGKIEKMEFYFFAKTGLKRVFYNGLIQGNWIGEQSPQTMEQRHWLAHFEYGVYFGLDWIGLGYSINHLGSETKKASNHTYSTINCMVKF